MAIKAVFFDMGETLCHQDPSTPEIVGAFLARRQLPVGARQLRQAYLAAMTYYSDWALKVDMANRSEDKREVMIGGFYQAMMASLGLRNRDELIAEIRSEVLEAGSHRYNALFPDVVPALRRLRDIGLRLGVVSNWDLTLAETVHGLGLTPYLETVISSAAVTIEKPNPEIFRYALESLEVTAGEALHVGDIYYMDVLGARAAGLTPVLIDRYSLQTNVDCLRVESLEQLPDLLRRS